MTDLEDKIAVIPGMSGDDGTEQRETADTLNRRGRPVNSGSHLCMSCKHSYDSMDMEWTTPPKVCLACHARYARLTSPR